MSLYKDSTFETSDEVEYFINGVPAEEHQKRVEAIKLVVPDLLETIERHNFTLEQVKFILAGMKDSGDLASRLMVEG